jgi:hypothetical protein
MSLHPAVFVFMTTWLGFTGLAAVALFVAALRGAGSAYQPLGPAVMFLFGWGMTLGAFSFEARRAERVLAEIINARAGASPGLQTDERLG